MSISLILLKPKFLTKEERAAEAIKGRQEQVAEQKRVVEVCISQRFPPLEFFFTKDSH